MSDINVSLSDLLISYSGFDHLSRDSSVRSVMMKLNFSDVSITNQKEQILFVFLND